MPKSSHKTFLLVLAVLAALLIAGCGGGGDDTETTTAPTVEEPAALTEEELIEEGDGICAEVNAAVGALSASESEEASAAGDSEKIANLYLGMVERLQELGTPEGDSGDYAKFMEAAEELAKVEGELKLAAEREDVATAEEKGQEAASALEEFQSQAAIYGFEDCSDEPGLPTPAGGGTPGGEEFEGEEAEGGVEVEPEYEEPAPEEEIVPEEEVAPETGGAGGGPEAPEPAPETGGESGGVGPG
ncbi:MAG TPA: hypothetical protein VNC16_09755 [Solirubrobacterales bacterium]|jgi:hypothetical protein|nr:hypothetical protein [Solirubrobacterales bacterium]